MAKIFISGPSASATVIGMEHVEPIIAALCAYNGDDPDEYTATDISALAAQPKPATASERPVCRYCGSHDVSSGATARWNDTLADWEITDVHDEGYCESCENEIKHFNWVKVGETT